MAVNFTTDELELIGKQEVTEEQRPVFFNAASQRLAQIGLDFEGYLILQTVEQKQKTLAWITEAEEIETSNKDRDELLSTFLDNREADADVRIAELESSLNNFSKFQSGLITDGQDSSRFAGIPEIPILVQSLSRMLEKILVQQEQSFHEKSLISILRNRLEREKTTDLTQRELSAWQNVIAFYEGQKESTGSDSKPGLASLGAKF